MHCVNNYILIVLALFVSADVCNAHDHDPNDFAVEVIFYDEGTGAVLDYLTSDPFDNPNNALGRPTVDTTGDNWNIPTFQNVPLVSVYPAFRFYELVTIGKGGELIVKFNHAVADDINNPYGIDFIVFGNSQQNTGLFWENGDPSSFAITGSTLIEEPAMVSVSQDGITWYDFDAVTSPMVDTFAPTLGRVYDPNNADESIGTWNQWWGEPTDATLPIDPNITSLDLLGLTVAEAAQLYGDSAGGTGFDLADVGLDWIEYVKIIGNDNVTPEVDAVSDVAACGDYKHPFPSGDFTEDCVVDFRDFAELAHVWEGNAQNLTDLTNLSNSWLDCTWKCQ